jgi:hypothetical protein
MPPRKPPKRRGSANAATARGSGTVGVAAVKAVSGAVPRTATFQANAFQL